MPPNKSTITGENRETEAEKIVNIGLAFNILLAIMKTIVGITGASAGLLADGINSSADVVYYLVVKVFIKISAKPADRQHPYGHNQMESISALVVGSFVIMTAIGIFLKSIGDAYRLFQLDTAETATASLHTLTVALATIIIKLGLSRITRRVGERRGHTAVIALAREHRNDIFSASAVAVGIVFAHYGLRWMDPMAGALVAVIILLTGIDILRESSSDLMDTLPDRMLNDKIREAIAPVTAVKTIEEVRAHRFGPYYAINLTIGIDGKLSVAQGDSIASDVEKRVTRVVGLVRRVYIHYHPARENPYGITDRRS